MPTSNEFEAMGDYTWSSNGTSTPNVSGTGPIYSGQTKNNGVGTPFFPAAGYRTYSNGALDLMGEQGYYWAGSPSNTHGYYMLFNSSIVFLKFINHRAYGYPVRCVAEAED